MESSSKTLPFLDPDLYSNTAGEELESHFICVICCGVVLDAVECTGCQTLYCKECLSSMSMPCPKLCGSIEYTKVNRFISNTLNKIKFKCQYKKCDQAITYENYLSHYNTCEEGQCQNPNCETVIKGLKCEILRLKTHMDEIETQKERNIQIHRNQIQELKQSLQGGAAPHKDSIQNLGKEKILLEEVNKLQFELETANSRGCQSKINSISCSKGHTLKQMGVHPVSNDLRCDICNKGNLLLMPFYFRCDQVCDYDICAFCYHLMLTDQKGLIENIQKHAENENPPSQKEQYNQEIHKNVKDLGKQVKKTFSSFGSIFKKE